MLLIASLILFLAFFDPPFARLSTSCFLWACVSHSRIIILEMLYPFSPLIPIFHTSLFMLSRIYSTYYIHTQEQTSSLL